MTSLDQPSWEGRFGAAAPGAHATPPSLEPLLTAPEPPARGMTWRHALTAAGIVVLIVGGYLAGHFTWPPPAPPLSQLVVTAGSLPAGTRLTAADLRVVSVRPGAAVPAGALSPAAATRLRGLVTRNALPAGTFVSSAMVAPGGAVPGPAQALVGLALKPGELPAGGLVAGQRVLVVELWPDAQNSTVTPIPLVTATVWDLRSAGSGAMQATVVVPARVASRLSAYAAMGNVALVGTGPGGGAPAAGASHPAGPSSSPGSSSPSTRGRTRTTKSGRTR